MSDEFKFLDQMTDEEVYQEALKCDEDYYYESILVEMSYRMGIIDLWTEAKAEYLFKSEEDPFAYHTFRRFCKSLVCTFYKMQIVNGGKLL